MLQHCHKLRELQRRNVHCQSAFFRIFDEFCSYKSSVGAYCKRSRCCRVSTSSLVRAQSAARCLKKTDIHLSIILLEPFENSLMQPPKKGFIVPARQCNIGCYLCQRQDPIPGYFLRWVRLGSDNVLNELSYLLLSPDPLYIFSSLEPEIACVLCIAFILLF